MLMSRAAEVKVTGNIGRSSSFEVTVNDKLVFSKLRLGGFPKEEDMLRAIQEAEDGLEPKVIEDSQSPGCCVM